MLCCGYTLTDFPISIRLTSLALWQSNDCPSASKATLMNMDKYFMWIHYERLHNHNKAKHNKTVCIFLGIYCTSPGLRIHHDDVIPRTHFQLYWPFVTRITSWFPQGQVTWRFDVVIYVTLNYLLNKQLSFRWSQTHWRSCDPNVKCMIALRPDLWLRTVWSEELSYQI